MLNLADGLKIERARNSFFIICESDQKVIILKEREAEILEMLSKHEMKNVINKMKKEYTGDNIESDIIEFSEKMLALGVLKES